MLSSLFVSHGSPELPLQTGAGVDFFSHLGQQLGKPQAILAISAHWETRQPTVSTASQPETIHDFYGFAPELYQMQYPAPGAPQLAGEVATLLQKAGIECELHPNRGLDHGVWTPLKLIYPEAKIPVTQLSIQPDRTPAYHWALGQALAPLRDRNILILATGSATHNLREFHKYAYDAAPPAWVSEFTNWLTDAVTQGKVDDLLNYRHLAPHATANHPTEEHLLPLFVAMGAGGNSTNPRLLHSSFTYGVLSMAAYGF